MNEEDNILYRRLKADFDNYRKRSDKDKDDYLTSNIETLLKDILPVQDTLLMAIRSMKTNGLDISYIQGLEGISKKFSDALIKNGIEPINCLGKIFDPTYHEAIETMIDNSVEEGTIIRVDKEGYTYRGKVIRVPLVIIAYNGLSKTIDDTIDHMCPICGTIFDYIEKYDRYWCQKCQKYAPKQFCDINQVLNKRKQKIGQFKWLCECGSLNRLYTDNCSMCNKHRPGHNCDGIYENMYGEFMLSVNNDGCYHKVKYCPSCGEKGA